VGDEEPDVIVADTAALDIEQPCEPRTKTAERPRSGRKITIDLDDADALSDFLLEISKLIRHRKRISVTIE
jgi:hypothetical protein